MIVYESIVLVVSAGLSHILQSAVGLVGHSADYGQTFSYVGGLTVYRLVQDMWAGKLRFSYNPPAS